LRLSLSYRDVEELLAERALSVDHVTVWRWVQRYAPELDRRLRKRLKTTSDSWRVDETLKNPTDNRDRFKCNRVFLTTGPG
jgi:IS6 family transposase